MWEIQRSAELYHHGVKGMKWGVRRKLKKLGGRIKTGFAKGAAKAKTSLRKTGNSEIAKRGKSALDVLKNGDTDWMGEHIYSDNLTTEVKNRGRAAVERLLYSQEQIDNKKFFGRYDF